MKRLIVFFPSWRYFGHFALPLFEPLTDKYDIVFFHTEKAVYGWDDCPDLSDRNIETVDLKSLKTFSFVKALKKLNPDCVVVFDKGWVQDRALLYAAQHLGVPSVHIQHGSTAMLDEVQTHHVLKRAIHEFFKITKTLWLFNLTVFQVSARRWMKSWAYQLQLLMNPNNYYFNRRDEVKADRACIAGASEREFFMQKEGYGEDQLVPMGSREQEAAYALLGKGFCWPADNRLLLLSQPLFEDNYLPGGMDAKLQCIRSIIDSAKRLENMSIAVKPHPREDELWYRDNFEDTELYIYPPKYDLNAAILENKFVLGFFSTALVNAMILKRPIGIIRWMGDHGYAPNFDEDGAAMPLVTADDLLPFVQEYRSDFDTSWYAYNSNVQEVLERTVYELVQMKESTRRTLGENSGRA
jgi:hypothetical protein